MHYFENVVIVTNQKSNYLFMCGRKHDARK